MSDSVKIGNRSIGKNNDVFIIAEIGINHNGDMDMAKQLIDQAQWAGVHAVKFQTYITEKRVPKDSPIFSLLKQCELSFDQQRELYAYATKKKILFFSTPFDADSVDFLTSLNVPCYKVASFDIVNTALLQKIASVGKPVIMSRGMANQKEIDTAVSILNQAGSEIILLHCISAYPVTDRKDLHLSTIAALRDRYQCPVGFSDHTIGLDAARYAVVLGASVIEKHFTLSRDSSGPDHALSTEPQEMKLLVSDIIAVQDMIGQPTWGSVPSEKDILQYRRLS